MDGADEVFDDVFELALAFDDGAHALQLFRLDDALDHGDGVALGNVIEVQPLRGFGFDAHLVRAQAEQVGDAGAHLAGDGADFGADENQRGVDVHDAVASALQRIQGQAEEDGRVGVLPARVAGREKSADVAGGDGAEQGVGDGVQQHVADALLGAIAAGDIGTFFPPGDPRWKDADSAIFLSLALDTLQRAGYRIVNIDTTLILTRPKIGPVSGEMRSRVADLLGLGTDQVSIKAKTPEGLNLDHVAQCHAVAMVERVIEPEELKSMSAVIESQRQLEDVVEDLISSVHGIPKKRGGLVYDTEEIT